ncbi:hypothetical protein DSL72_001637 [Monilinia vaccinii-corymbosi]|uniref:Uncharacterized protein n=1 Tax=Monilinia vaccinii-corymbosi TaxID=61207 RepID=A0A8A3P9G6_9HELO|nr:hypothetical protein DSL72_001637 [Monilinia vaccinii-corymbosi]
MAQQLPVQGVNARKYGSWKHNPNISGLTPLPSLFPKAQIDPQELATRRKIERFQRKLFHTFTARDLAGMDVITDRELKSSSLDNPVMPMLRPNRWESKPSTPQFTREEMYPLTVDGEEKGEWSMLNPLVFEVMKPVLQLATRTITSMYTLPWFGALLFGDRLPIDQHRIRQEDVDKISKITTSFHPCNEISHTRVQLRMQEVFMELEKVWGLTFGFMSPNQDPRGPEHDSDDGESDDEGNSTTYGLCVTNYAQMAYGNDEKNASWGIWIFLNYQRVQALFRNDLTSAERRMIEWASAVTIVHEIIHAITYITPGSHITAEQNLYHDTPPPFFDWEPLAEAGFSFEAALNGGICRPFLVNESGLPYGHWFETVWPTVEAQDLCASEAVTLRDPSPFLYQEFFPIPASFYDDIQQGAFWECLVKRFGHKLFHFRVLKQGSRVDFTLQESAETPILFQATAHRRFTRETTYLEPTSKILRERWAMAHNLNSLQELSQGDREAEACARSFLERSNAENRFWLRMEDQSRSVDLIFEQLLRGNTSHDQSIPELEQLVELVSTIVRNHERTIDVILETGQPTNLKLEVPSQERKSALLAWNRGTNIFISKCKQQKPIRENKKLMGQLVAESLALEICRMRLFTPDFTPESRSAALDFHELALLIKLQASLNKKDGDQCYDYCSQLRAVEGCSLLATLCVKFCLFWLHSGSETSAERAVQLQEMKWEHAILLNLRAKAPGSWVGTFKFWGVVAQAAINKVKSFHEM